MPMEIDADEEEDVGHPTEDPDDFPITSTKRPTGPQEPADKVSVLISSVQAHMATAKSGLSVS